MNFELVHVESELTQHWEQHRLVSTIHMSSRLQSLNENKCCRSAVQGAERGTDWKVWRARYLKLCKLAGDIKQCLPKQVRAFPSLTQWPGDTQLYLRGRSRVCAQLRIACAAPSPLHNTARLYSTQFRCFSITTAFFIVPPQWGRCRHIMAATVASYRSLFSLLWSAPNSLVCTAITDHSVVFHTAAI